MRMNSPTMICAIAAILLHLHVAALEVPSYPKSREISYGGVVVQVRPANYTKLKAPIGGKLYLKKESGPHEKGIVWAELEPELIAREREVMDISLMLEELKTKPLVKLEWADTRAGLENRRDELKRNLAMTEEILAEPDLAELYLGKNQHDAGNSRSTIEEMNNRLIKQLEAIEEALLFIGTPDQENAELRLAELQLERKNLDLKRKEDESRLKMPFSGELRLLVDPPEDPEAPLMLNTGQEIAEIADYSKLQCDMIVSRSDFRQLPTPSLALEFRRNGEPGLRAAFKSQRTMEIAGRSELVYIFEFSDELSFAARSLLGGRVTADLIVTLQAEAHLIPKLELVRAYPEQIRDQGWQVGLETAFPGYRVLAVGQSNVAVFPKIQSDE